MGGVLAFFEYFLRILSIVCCRQNGGTGRACLVMGYCAWLDECTESVGRWNV